MTVFKKDLHGMTFGQLLRHFRIEQLMTIGELSKKSSVSKAYISMLEHGVRQPGLSALRRLVSALQLDGEDFSITTETALRHAPPFMCEREGPDRPDTRSRSERTASDAACAAPIKVPPLSKQEAEFLRRAKVITEWQHESCKDVHPPSPEFTNDHLTTGKPHT